MTKRNSDQEVAIVGAGLVGSLLALMLARRGYKVDIFEKRSDMRKAGAKGGRSINLALSTRGWEALEIAGIKEKIEEIAIPMYGRRIHHSPSSKEQDTSFQSYGQEDQAIYSVSRSQLNIELIDAAEAHPDVHFYFHKKCEGADLHEGVIHLKDENSQAIEQHQYPLIFGADGAFSAIRTSMQKTDRFNYSQSFLEHGYKELSIPPAEEGGWRLEKNALHIWPRKRFMLIALPNLDGSFTSTLFLPFDGSPSFEELTDKQRLEKFFRKQFPDALEQMPTLKNDFFENPTSSLVTIRCFPWHRNHTCLIGDAAHAIVPFYGQGMNAGFEDCTILNQLIDDYKEDWDEIFPVYENQRKKDNDAIADLAIQNFIEMRDHVDDPQFLMRKKLERKINELYPEKFQPLYSLVTFSHTPYAEAQKEGERQSRILDQIMEKENVQKVLDNGQVEKTIAPYIY